MSVERRGRTHTFEMEQDLLVDGKQRMRAGQDVLGTFHSSPFCVAH